MARDRSVRRVGADGRPLRSPAVPPSPTQLVWRERIEAGLRVAAPALDLLLAAGDRVSRVLAPDGPEEGVRRSPRTPIGHGAQAGENLGRRDT